MSYTMTITDRERAAKMLEELGRNPTKESYDEIVAFCEKSRIAASDLGPSAEAILNGFEKRFYLNCG